MKGYNNEKGSTKIALSLSTQHVRRVRCAESRETSVLPAVSVCRVSIPRKTLVVIDADISLEHAYALQPHSHQAVRWRSCAHPAHRWIPEPNQLVGVGCSYHRFTLCMCVGLLINRSLSPSHREWSTHSMHVLNSATLCAFSGGREQCIMNTFGAMHPAHIRQAQWTFDTTSAHHAQHASLQLQTWNHSCGQAAIATIQSFTISLNLLAGDASMSISSSLTRGDYWHCIPLQYTPNPS